MEPSASAEMDGGKAKERKKIQFPDMDEDGDKGKANERKKIQFSDMDEDADKGKANERKKIQFSDMDEDGDKGKAKERKKIQFAAMDEDGDDARDERKIHFAVPSSVPTQLDPRQVEMIRRRRPTPATLFRVADQSSPEDDQSTHQWVVGENGVLKPKRVNPNVYQPPSLRAVQKMAEAQMQHLGVYPPLEDYEGEEYEDYSHWHGEKGEEERIPTDQQGTTTADLSEKASSVTDTAKVLQEDEEDEEEEKKEKTEENRRGGD